PQHELFIHFRTARYTRCCWVCSARDRRRPHRSTIQCIQVFPGTSAYGRQVSGSFKTLGVAITARIGKGAANAIVGPAIRTWRVVGHRRSYGASLLAPVLCVASSHAWETALGGTRRPVSAGGKSTAANSHGSTVDALATWSPEDSKEFANKLIWGYGTAAFGE